MSRRSGQLAHLAASYGMTEEDYNATLEAQDYVCAICHEPETKKRDDGSDVALSVDHCHETGKVRGLLCHGCNTALGLLRDDPERIRRAVEYVGGSLSETLPGQEK